MDATDAGDTLPEGSVPPILIVPDGDTNAVDLALTQNTNGVKLQSSISRSISDASNGDEANNDTIGKDKLKNNAADAANASKEKRQAKTKTRVIQSRFRSGLSNSKNNNSSSSKSGLSNSENNNCTISGPSASNSTGKSRTARAQPPVKSGIGKSVSNLSRVTAHSASNLTSKSRPIKSTTNLNESLHPGAGDFKKIGGRSKLHSTVLAERTMLGSTNNLFSTTLIGGIEHGKQKLVGSKKLDTTISSLPELPDISAIRLDSTNSDKSGDVTTLSAASEKDSSQEKSSETLREITYEELLKEYSRYLQSVYIDAVSEDAFSKQLEELKAQLVFLDQLTSVKQMEVDETKQKLELLNHHQYVLEAHKTQMEELQKLVESLPESEAALKVLTRKLEKNLHQVKMDNLYVPENHETYRDDLTQALKDQIMSLSELDSLMEPCSHQLTSTITLLDDIQIYSQRIQQYEREVNQASRLAIQEASLQIVAKHVNDNAKEMGP